MRSQLESFSFGNSIGFLMKRKLFPIFNVHWSTSEWNRRITCNQMKKKKLSPWYHLDNIYGDSKNWFSFILPYAWLFTIVAHLWHIFYTIPRQSLYVDFQVSLNAIASTYDREKIKRHFFFQPVSIRVAVRAYNVNNKSDGNQCERARTHHKVSAFYCGVSTKEKYVFCSANNLFVCEFRVSIALKWLDTNGWALTTNSIQWAIIRSKIQKEKKF